MTQTQPDCAWMTIVEACAATGFTERTLQRHAKDGKIERQDRGYGKVYYRITDALRKDRRGEETIISLLREQNQNQTVTIDKAATALSNVASNLGKRIDSLQAETFALQNKVMISTVAAMFLLATSVGMGAWIYQASKGRETLDEMHNATMRQMSATLSQSDARLSEERKRTLDLSRELRETQLVTSATSPTKATSASSAPYDPFKGLGSSRSPYMIHPFYLNADNMSALSPSITRK